MRGLSAWNVLSLENKIEERVPNTRNRDLDGTDAALQHHRHRSSSTWNLESAHQGETIFESLTYLSRRCFPCAHGIFEAFDWFKSGHCLLSGILARFLLVYRRLVDALTVVPPSASVPLFTATIQLILPTGLAIVSMPL